MENGILTSIGNWIMHPIYSDGNLKDWGAFLVLVICVSFLWTTVIKQIASEGIAL